MVVCMYLYTYIRSGSSIKIWGGGGGGGAELFNISGQGGGGWQDLFPLYLIFKWGGGGGGERGCKHYQEYWWGNS